MYRVNYLILIMITLSFVIVSCDKDENDNNGGSTTQLVDIEGNEYKVVNINNQLWMAENLKTTKYNDGSNIINAVEDSLWFTNTAGAYSWYDNDGDSFSESLGALYNWYAVNSGKLCPDNWRVPSDNDWNNLINYLGGDSIAGAKLKSIDKNFWNEPNTGASDEYDFNGLAGGMRMIDGRFYGLGEIAQWHSSTEINETNASSFGAHTNGTDLFNASQEKSYGFYVRCVK